MQVPIPWELSTFMGVWCLCPFLVGVLISSSAAPHKGMVGVLPPMLGILPQRHT